MEYEINTQCPACDGYGIHENQIAVDEFVDSDCHECEGSGLVMHTGMYDSEEDAKADYPESFIKPLICRRNKGTLCTCSKDEECPCCEWNRAQAVQRGEMIAKQIFSST